MIPRWMVYPPKAPKRADNEPADLADDDPALASDFDDEDEAADTVSGQLGRSVNSAAGHLLDDEPGAVSAGERAGASSGVDDNDTDLPSMSINSAFSDSRARSHNRSSMNRERERESAPYAPRRSHNNSLEPSMNDYDDDDDDAGYQQVGAAQAAHDDDLVVGTLSAVTARHVPSTERASRDVRNAYAAANGAYDDEENSDGAP